MSGVGGVACSLVHGRPGVLQNETKTWSVPGIDSVGVHVLGTRGLPARIRVVLYDSTVNVEAWIVAITALVGQIVTVVDEYAVTSGPQLVKRASQPRRRPATFEGGVRCEIDLQLMAV